MLFAGNVYLIVSIVTFSLMFDYLIVGFDVIHFRRTGITPPFRMPLYPYLPVIGITILGVFMLSLPLEVLVAGLAIFIFLALFYQLLGRAKSKDNPTGRPFQ